MRSHDDVIKLISLAFSAALQSILISWLQSRKYSDQTEHIFFTTSSFFILTHLMHSHVAKNSVSSNWSHAHLSGLSFLLDDAGNGRHPAKSPPLLMEVAPDGVGGYNKVKLEWEW